MCDAGFFVLFFLTRSYTNLVIGSIQHFLSSHLPMKEHHQSVISVFRPEV